MDSLAIKAEAFAGLDRFHEIPDAAAIVVNKHGVYRQVKVFRRGQEAYASFSGGFIRLFRKGGTSSPHIRYVGLDLAGLTASEDSLGRLLLGGDHAS